MPGRFSERRRNCLTWAINNSAGIVNKQSSLPMFPDKFEYSHKGTPNRVPSGKWRICGKLLLLTFIWSDVRYGSDGQVSEILFSRSKVFGKLGNQRQVDCVRQRKILESVIPESASFAGELCGAPEKPQSCFRTAGECRKAKPPAAGTTAGNIRKRVSSQIS